MEPEQKTESSSSQMTSDDMLGTVVYETASEFTQQLSDKPSSASGKNLPNKLKLAPGNRVAEIGRADIIGSYRLSVPILDETVATKQLAKLLDYMAQNHQRTQLTAFWEDYPNAVLQTPSEREAGYPDRQELRRDYQKYNKRMANYVIRYYNWSLMHAAAGINLLSTSRLIGNQKMAKIASNVRWSWLNNNITANWRLWPVAKGGVQLMTDAAKYLIGETNYSAKFAAMPLFATECYGNGGCRSVTFGDVVSAVNKQGSVTITPNFEDDAEHTSKELKVMKQLITNINRCEPGYPRAIRSKDDQVVEWWPHMIGIENGAVMYYQNGEENTLKRSLAGASFGLEYIQGHDGAMVTDDPLTSTLWNNYFFFETMGKKMFAEMSDPESDIRVFLMKLGMFDEPRPFGDMYDAIRANKNIAADEFFKKMQYKNGNKPTTATVVSYVPILDWDLDADSKWQEAFERYNTDITNISEYLTESKAWPGNTPTMFADVFGDHDDSDTIPDPIVINALPPVGYEGNALVPRRAGFFGKFAVMFDHLCTRNLDDQSGYAEAYGVTGKWLEEFCKINDGIVFEEDPSTIHVLRKPILDNTDPYSCGINLMLQDDTYNNSEAESWYTTRANFSIPDLPNEASAVAPYLKDGSTLVYQHTSIAQYLAYKKIAFVFVGKGIYELPVFAMSHANSLVLPYECEIPDDADWNNSTYGAFFRDIIAASACENENLIQPAFGDSWAPKGTKVITEYFDSAYGPVLLSLADSSYKEIRGWDIMGQIPSFTGAPRCKSITEHGVYAATDNTDNNYRRALPWLYCICFNPAYYSETAKQYYIDDSRIKEAIFFADSYDYNATKLLHSIIQHLGIEDTVPFWSGKNIKAIAESFDGCDLITAGLTMETNGLIMKIREIRKSFNKFKERNVSNQKHDNSYVYKNVAANFGDSVSSSTSAKKSAKGKHSHSKPHSKGSSDHVSENEKTFAPEENNLSFSDASSSAVDKQFGKNAKTPADPISGQIG